MTSEQKEKAAAAHSRLAGWLTAFGLPANWSKVGAGIIIGAVVGALATCQQSCSQLSPAQLSAAHDFYHAFTGSECCISIHPCEK